ASRVSTGASWRRCEPPAPERRMDTLPLFPLNAVLFPKGRIALQIFESRYIDMIRECLRHQSGFGVVLIEHGSEVARPGMKLDLHRVGTVAEVVDWNQLPNGLLGITAQGRETFRIVESWREANDLCMAKVELRAADGVGAEPLPVGDEHRGYVDLLRGLARHPAIEELRLDIACDDLREVAWRLSEFLPVSNRDKQALLELEDIGERLALIEHF